MGRSLPSLVRAGRHPDDHETNDRTVHAGALAQVVDEYDREEHESALLLEAARTVDLLDTLNTNVQTEGAIIDSPQGRRANPAAVESRHQRMALARLIAVLRLPSGEGDQATRPQRRAGARAPYIVRPGA